MKNRDTGTDPVILVEWEKNFTTKQKIDGCKAKLEEIAKLQLSFKSNPPKDTNLLMKKRKQLAVLLTVLGEKEEVGAG